MLKNENEKRQYIRLHKHMADKLEIFIYGSKEKYNILIIGYKSDEFNKKIVKRFPNSNIDIMDLEKKNIESYNFDKKYDVIFSNGEFQLTESLKELFDRLHSALNFGGKLVFSLIGGRICNIQYEENICKQKFITSKEIKKIIGKKYRILIVDEEIIKEDKFLNTDLIYIVLEKIESQF